jgi:hypothetical protein
MEYFMGQEKLTILIYVMTVHKHIDIKYLRAPSLLTRLGLVRMVMATQRLLTQSF